jgi:hypothetical protein
LIINNYQIHHPKSNHQTCNFTAAAQLIYVPQGAAAHHS